MSSEPKGQRARSRGLVSDMASAVCGLYLDLCGWKIRGDWPSDPKAVIVAAFWLSEYPLPVLCSFNCSMKGNIL